MTKATIKLHPQQFKIMGPPALIAMVQIITSSPATSSEEMKYQIDDLLSNWYVNCSVSGEQVSLYKLKYWNVEKQEVYARPELVPGSRVSYSETPFPHK